MRDDDALSPSADQVAVFRRDLPGLRERLAAHKVRVVADETMFDDAGGTTPKCGVPGFAAYVRADTGEVYGCNILAHADGPIGNLLTTPPDQVWRGEQATVLRTRCATATNAACARCDPSSRAMNHALREFATHGAKGDSAP